MPITKSAKKALRGSDKKRIVNIRRKKNVEVAVKNVKKLAATTVGKGEKKATVTALSAAYKALDKAAKVGLIKKGAASRKKSRLAAAIRKASAK
jgi:small subunit ribosomal protein S20